jgi:hypothetical protein
MFNMHRTLAHTMAELTTENVKLETPSRTAKSLVTIRVYFPIQAKIISDPVSPIKRQCYAFGPGVFVH